MKEQYIIQGNVNVFVTLVILQMIVLVTYLFNSVVELPMILISLGIVCVLFPIWGYLLLKKKIRPRVGMYVMITFILLVFTAMSLSGPGFAVTIFSVLFIVIPIFYLDVSASIYSTIGMISIVLASYFIFGPEKIFLSEKEFAEFNFFYFLFALLVVVGVIIRQSFISRKLVSQIEEEMKASEEKQVKLEEMIASIYAITKNIDEQKVELNHHLSISDTASENLVAAFTQMASSYEREVSTIEEISLHLQSFEGSIHVMNEEVVRNKDIMHYSQKKIDEMREKVEQMTRYIEQVQGTFENSVTSVSDLSTKTKQIHEIIRFISDVANQTNLLSLNASIEAARAGESGRGFGVVAQEIKKLADASQRSVHSIQQILSEIEQSVEITVQQTVHSQTEMAQSAKMIQEVEGSFFELQKATQDVIRNSEGIEQKTNTALVETNGLKSAIETIADVSHENNASIQNSFAEVEQLHKLNGKNMNIFNEIKEKMELIG